MVSPDFRGAGLCRPPYELGMLILLPSVLLIGCADRVTVNRFVGLDGVVIADMEPARPRAWDTDLNAGWMADAIDRIADSDALFMARVEIAVPGESPPYAAACIVQTRSRAELVLSKEVVADTLKALAFPRPENDAELELFVEKYARNMVIPLDMKSVEALKSTLRCFSAARCTSVPSIQGDEQNTFHVFLLLDGKPHTFSVYGAALFPLSREVARTTLCEYWQLAKREASVVWALLDFAEEARLSAFRLYGPSAYSDYQWSNPPAGFEQ